MNFFISKLLLLVEKSIVDKDGFLIIQENIEEAGKGNLYPSITTLQSTNPREWLASTNGQDTETTLAGIRRQSEDQTQLVAPRRFPSQGDRESISFNRRGSFDPGLRRRSEDVGFNTISGRRRSVAYVLPEMKEEPPLPKKGTKIALEPILSSESELINAESLIFLDIQTRSLISTPSIALFECQTRNSLKKIGLGERYVQIIINLKQSFWEDKEKTDPDISSRFRGKELSEIINVCLKKLSRMNKLGIILGDLQYADNSSLEIIQRLLEVPSAVAYMFFCRPKWTYDSDETRILIDHIKNSHRMKHMQLQGFSLLDTAELVMDIWANNAITSVNQKITEGILSRTNGNPFFIKSLAIAMKESGQWRISPIGELLPTAGTLDAESLALGYDNQGVILGHFDRIDRNLQLFLKVAAVLGIKWSLDDVLFFITGIMNLSSKLEQDNYNSIIKAVMRNDRYGFLQVIPSNPYEKGAYFGFKSPVIRKCIYSLMAPKQRQQVHLYAAQYYECKLTDFNKHKYLTTIMEHYMETDDEQLDNKFIYVRLVAKYFYDIGLASEAVTHYGILLQMTAQHPSKSESDIVMANWYREYGESLYFRGYMGDGYLAIVKSLKLMDFILPETKLKFNWAANKLIKTYLKDLQEFYTSSLFQKKTIDYSTDALSGTGNASKSNARISVIERLPNPIMNSSGNIFDNASSFMKSQKNIFSSNVVAKQHALQVLSEIFLQRRDYDLYTFVVIHGLSIQDKEASSLISARLYSSAAVIFTLSEKSEERRLAAKSMDAAFLLDDRSDLQTSLIVTVNDGTMMLLNGKLKQSLKYFEISSRICCASCNLPMQFKSMRLKAAITFLNTGRQPCGSIAAEILLLSIRYESWEGKFWGLFHTIICLFLEGPASSTKVNERSKEMATLWTEGPLDSKSQLIIRIAHVCITACVPLFVFKMFVSEPGNLVEHLKDLVDLVNGTKYFDWELFECFKPLILGFFAAISHNCVTPKSATASIIQKTCDSINSALKRIRGLVFKDSLRRIFKGLKLLACGKKHEAVLAWEKGLDADSEAIWYQGVLQVAIGHYSAHPPIKNFEKGQKIMNDLDCPDFKQILHKFS